MKLKLVKYDVTFEEALNHNICLSVWISGCKLDCNGCNALDIKRFDVGEEIELNEMINKLNFMFDICDTFVLMGGNPPDSPIIILEILKATKKIGYNNWVYTGYTIDEILKLEDKRWLEYTDYIKVGMYDKTKLVKDYKFASSNQEVFHVKLSDNGYEFTNFIKYNF